MNSSNEKEEGSGKGGWWGYMGSAWNSIQETAKDFTESIRNENEETITKVKDKIDKTEIKTKLTTSVSTMGTMINDTVHKIEDKIQKEKHSSRPFWFKKNNLDSNGNEIDLEAGSNDSCMDEAIIPKPFEKERATYAIDLESSEQHSLKYKDFLSKNEENKIDEAALCLEGRKLKSRNTAIETWFDTLVPQTVDELTFWQRYFYWKYITEKRERMIQRHSNDAITVNSTNNNDNNKDKNDNSNIKSKQDDNDNNNGNNNGNNNASNNKSESGSIDKNENLTKGARKGKTKNKKQSGFSIIGKIKNETKKNDNVSGSNSNSSESDQLIEKTVNLTNSKTDEKNDNNDSEDDKNQSSKDSSQDNSNSENENCNDNSNENETENENNGIVGATRLADTDEDNGTNKTETSGDDDNENNGHFSETSWQAVSVMKSQSNDIVNDESPPKTYSADATDESNQIKNNKDTGNDNDNEKNNKNNQATKSKTKEMTDKGHENETGEDWADWE